MGAEKKEVYVDPSTSQECIPSNLGNLKQFRAATQRAANEAAGLVTPLPRKEQHNFVRTPQENEMVVEIAGEVLQADRVVRAIEACRAECQIQDGQLIIHLSELTDRKRLVQLLNQVGGNDGFSSDEVFRQSA